MLSKKGQAMIEILPMIVVFFTAISAAIAYFQVMRNAIMVQEAARNATFAKIANSGPMVTPPPSSTNPTGELRAGSYEGNSYRMIAGGASNEEWSANSTCLTVLPGQSIVPERLPRIMDEIHQLGEATRAVIYRNPGSQCQ